MKPNFALDLTHDGIGLMHRGKGGWVLVGEVSLTDPSLPHNLSMMRQRAGDLDKGGFTSKLIIPPSQILFTSMTAPGPDDITREARIREGLVGLTPYPVEELAFDWYADGDMAHVAIVARETLAEAEGFAVENRMNPVCFTARPHGSFTREVSFGETSCAGQHLGQGGEVEREHRAPPELMGTQIGPLADQTSEPQAPASKPADSPEPQPAPQAQATKPHPAATTTDSPTDSPADTSGAKPPSAPPELAPFPPDFEPEEDAPARPTPQKKVEPPKPPKGASPAREETGVSKATPDAKPAPSDPANAGLATLDTGSSTGPSTPQSKPRESKPRAGSDSPKAPSKAAQDTVPAFSTRRAGTGAPADRTGAGPQTADIAPRINVVPPSAPSASEKTAASASPDLPPAPAPRVQTEIHVPVTAPTVDGQDNAPKPKKRTATAKAKAGANGAAGKLKDAARKGLAGASGASSIASSLAKATSKSLSKRTSRANGANGAKGATGAANGTTDSSLATPNLSAPAHGEVLSTAIAPPPPSARSSARNKTPKASTAAQERARKEADALTIFGARKSQEVGGKPKYLGLFLVLGLLLMMAVLAVWSMFFLSEQNVDLFPDAEDQFESAITSGPAPSLDEANQLARSPALQPDADVIANADIGAGAEALTNEAGLDADDAPTPERLSPEAAEIRYAATGIWERAPDPLDDPESGRIDELYVASIDPVTAVHDAVALPLAKLGDAVSLPANRLPPPPQGTRFDLDERGLVRATPEGSLTPKGVTVYAGRPALVPTPRPDGIAPQAEVETADLAPADPADPSVPRTRPRLRPEGLIESNERRLLGGRTRSELAALRPAPRPANPQALVQQAAAIAEAIANAEEGADQASLAVAAIAPTELAIARSLEPKSRPRNFDKLVAAARAANDASDGSVVVAAAPRNQTVTPNIPTRASVATQATIKNAIPMRKVALIGISGSASNRRALVRLKSGRYVKVGVGDRLDGGRVLSITTNQLIYKKGSRSTTLKILPFG
ncbi:hypothetical protein [Aliiroseovarius crassostreae]|uniref:hypothetical protein n=1 Tax=Aliiroseovarius crassostreae TaxID=154981 RepID=UPI003C7E33CD